jgi:hypothetical protein
MSRTVQNKPENFLLSENTCPSCVIAEHKEFERNVGIDVRSLSLITAAFVETNAEERHIRLMEILQGKCQRKRSHEIVEFWRFLQTSVESLQVRCVFLTFVT